MGFLDKVKQGAEQAKTMAASAAERAKDEAKELGLRRQLNGEEEALGTIAFDLVERGEVSHAELTPGVERIRALRAELEGLSAPEGGEKPEQATPAEPGPSEPGAAAASAPEQSGTTP